MRIADLMAQSGVTFGTSGARGLSDDITDLVGYCYTRAFLQHLESQGGIAERRLAVAGDLRPSTGRIMRAVMKAGQDAGFAVENCGCVPSPAVAYSGLIRGMPTVMVTGSHIPSDRNGIKYTTPCGEITKSDEQGIKEQVVDVSPTLFRADGSFKEMLGSQAPEEGAEQAYLARYLEAFPRDLLKGRSIGVYQHSAVGRDMLVTIYERLGAQVTALGRSDEFIPVDTEAIRPEDAALAKRWAQDGRFDAIVSTDGDSDRPLLADEAGVWLRGDILGILTAEYLRADAVVTPVSCNTAVEKSGVFRRVYRTRIGSPYVIAGMEQAARDGFERVVGYEANGGFLHHGDIELEHGVLRALPTRDGVIVHLAVLSLAAARGVPVSALRASLPARYTASDRLKECPTAKSAAVIGRLSAGLERNDFSVITDFLGEGWGAPASADQTDGLRITLDSGEIVHLRPSGNAPEFRCYTEADSDVRAEELLRETLALIAREVKDA